MKSTVLIGLILMATLGVCMAAETHMTIQTNTTIRIDPVTGDIKGGAQTQIKGIKIEPAPTASSATGTSSTSTDPNAGTVPGGSSTNTSTDPAPATGGTSTNTAPVGAPAQATPSAGPTPGISSAGPASTCPLAQVPGGQTN
ncbi:MAG TPA: hypothetical protein VK463_05435 [Desulfomonilaceae bacterium]|nr:hypothetical protein [Desulfomonilaceae bacterium]